MNSIMQSNMIYNKVMSNLYMFSPRMHDWVPSEIDYTSTITF